MEERIKTEYPVVGDYVDVLWNAQGDSLIEKIHERKSYLVRPDRCGHAEGYVKNLKEQAIVANFDYVFIVASLNQNFNVNRIARYISVVLQGGGKSTMLNAIAGAEVMKVNQIREADGRGKHTTTHRHLFTLKNGVTIIDTPGMREIGVCDVDKGLEDTFSDVIELTKQCRFGNCNHKTEPGCAVRQALESGSLSEKRWELYTKLQNENAWAKSMKGKMRK